MALPQVEWQLRAMGSSLPDLCQPDLSVGAWVLVQFLVALWDCLGSYVNRVYKGAGMKRLVGSFLLLVCLVLFAANGWAGSSCVQTFKCFGTGDLCLLSMAWTAHTDGSFTATNVGATHLKALGC